jgi:hypothetical protein
MDGEVGAGLMGGSAARAPVGTVSRNPIDMTTGPGFNNTAFTAGPVWSTICAELNTGLTY